MSLLRSLRNDNPLWEQRAVHAPKVVMLRPDMETTSGSPNSSSISSSSSESSKGSYHAASVRYLDEYGHDVTPYYKECTTDLEGLKYDLAFGEDLIRLQMDSGAAVCWGLNLATACYRGSLHALRIGVNAMAVVGVCLPVSHGSKVKHSAYKGKAGMQSTTALRRVWSLRQAWQASSVCNDSLLQHSLMP